MAKATPLICNFNAGEVSSRIDARTDIAKYFNACRTLQNFIPMVEGGVMRMPGTYFVGEVKNSAKKTRLIPFHFSTIQAYQLEFGEYYIRFCKDHGLIVLGVAEVADLANFNPAGAYFIGEYTKVGPKISINAGGGTKYLHVAAPYGLTAGNTIRIGCATNGGGDTLAVTANDAGIQTRNPTSDESLSGDWDGSAGTRYTVVDDYPASTGDHIHNGTTAGDLTFGFSVLTVPAGASTISVVLKYYESESSGGGQSVGGRLKVGGNYYNHATPHEPDGVTTLITDTWTLNPKTGLAWTVDDVNGVGVNALQAFGWGSTDANPTIIFYSIQCQVNYTPIDTINIKLANTTPAKNSATLIQTALRALATVNSVDVSAWTVTENAAYAIARPTAGISIDPALVSANATLYRSKAIIEANADNTGYFPPQETACWTLVTLGDAVEIVTTYTEDEILEIKRKPQSADTFYIFHPNHNPAKLLRHSHVNWELIDIEFVDNSRTRGITSITRATKGKVYCSAHGFNNGNQIFFCSIQGMTQLNYTTRAIDGVFTDYFELASTDTRNFSLYLRGGSAQRAITGITKASTAVVTQPNNGLSDGDIIKMMGVVGMTELNGNNYTVRNPTTNTYELEGVNSTAYGVWTYGGGALKLIFNKTDERPAIGSFFEQRLMVAGMKNYPQMIKGSVSSDFENFTMDAMLDDAAIEYSIVSDKVDKIRWIVGEEFMLIGTAGGVWKMGASTSVDPFTQTNISAKRQIGMGVSNISPDMVIDSILWLTRSEFSIRQIIWSFENDKYIAPNMTRLASHIALGSTLALSGIKDMIFQKEPIPILWCVRRDGQLLGMTYEIAEQVYAWFRVVTDGYFESVSVISNDGVEDEVWVIVNRGTLAVPKRYIEYFKPQEFYGVIQDTFFVHSGLTRTLTSETQVTITHLANKAVDVVIGGVYIGRKTASAGGVVTLGGTYSGVCHVGLPFTSKVEPMKLNVGSALGTSRSKKQRINSVSVSLLQTCKGKIGPDDANLLPIDVSAVAGVLVNDEFDVEYGGDWGNDARLCIVQDEPYPMTILSLVPRLSLNED